METLNYHLRLFWAAVATVTSEGKATWVITRVGGRIASLSDGIHDVAVDRDGDGAIEGVTATEL